MAADSHDTEQAWLAAIVESSDDAIIAKDLNGVVTGWNAAAERLFGFTSAEMLGRPLTVIFPADRADEEAMILNRIARGEHIKRYETERQHKDQHVFPVLVTVSPIRNGNGELLGASNTTRDLSERRAHEKRVHELQAELTHVQRLSELGQFMSALVHEVNQPLTAITNYLNGCQRLIRMGNLERLPGVIEQVENQTIRTREIVQRIRDFVKKRDLAMQPENLAQVVEETIELTRNTARGEDFEVTTSIPSCLLVQADRVQLQQVLFNLLRNGLEAMGGLRHREIWVTAVPTLEGTVEVSVEDGGPGVSRDVEGRLFQPFATTKPNGMGIGLSVCRTIIEAHGGRLWAENGSSKGAIFRFTLRISALNPPT